MSLSSANALNLVQSKNSCLVKIYDHTARSALYDFDLHCPQRLLKSGLVE